MEGCVHLQFTFRVRANHQFYAACSSRRAAVFAWGLAKMNQNSLENLDFRKVILKDLET